MQVAGSVTGGSLVSPSASTHQCSQGFRESQAGSKKKPYPLFLLLVLVFALASSLCVHPQALWIGSGFCSVLSSGLC